MAISRAKRTRTLAGVLGSIVMAAACSAGASAHTEVRADAARRTVPDGAAGAATTALDALALDLYRVITANENGNVVLSPYSIGEALAMVRAGASGPTAAEIEHVLHTASADELFAGLDAIDHALATRSGVFERSDTSKDSVELRVANGLFGQQGTNFEQPFLTTLAEDFGAGIQTVDYEKDTEAARRKINAWVEDLTHDRIKDLIGPGVLDTLTRLVAVNAIYLNAGWKFPFEESSTAPRPFHLADGSTVDAPLMSLSKEFRYGSGAGWQAVELPYIGDKLAMVAIVPDAGAFASFERGFDGAVLDGVLGSLSQDYVELQFPKFEFSTHETLSEVLTQLGMPTAFSGHADFSAVTKDEPLYLKDVVHQAYIKVNEKGTEAAAATAAVFNAVSGRIGGVSLTVDRPFVFVIRDVATGTPLFIGRVMNPTA